MAVCEMQKRPAIAPSGVHDAATSTTRRAREAARRATTAAVALMPAPGKPRPSRRAGGIGWAYCNARRALEFGGEGRQAADARARVRTAAPCRTRRRSRAGHAGSAKRAADSARPRRRRSRCGSAGAAACRDAIPAPASPAQPVSHRRRSTPRRLPGAPSAHAGAGRRAAAGDIRGTAAPGDRSPRARCRIRRRDRSADAAPRGDVERRSDGDRGRRSISRTAERSSGSISQRTRATATRSRSRRSSRSPPRASSSCSSARPSRCASRAAAWDS